MRGDNHKSFSKKTLEITTPLCMFFFFFFLHSFTIFVAARTEPPYVPRDNITLDCGSDSDNTVQGRTWTAETRSKLLLFEQNNTSVVSTADKSPSTIVPYRTARLSRSQFSYAFPITAGPKFVRLYFYPASYPNFNSSAAFFSVKAGRFTLLSNFSAALHARGLEVFSKEFCVNVDNEQRLNLTFSPAPGIADAYAFVNGIEVVSMPDDLYYSGVGDPGVNFVGQTNPLPIDRTKALELMYRINMGGNSLSSMQDSGLYRIWTMDNDYLTDAQSSALPANSTIQPVYNNRTRFAAPDQVYRTARTMGMDKTVNENHNLTWEFLVDSLFTYFVRLHFCEFQPLILAQGDRVFEIYMANQTAEDHADVIEWAGRYGIPVFRDYAVMIGAKGSEKFQNISIALHPLPERETSYSDAILNGLEIFKLSESDNLAGPNPDPLPIRPPTGVANVPISSKSKSNRITIVTSVAGSVSAIILFSLLVFFILHRRKKAKDSRSSDGASFFTTSAKSTKSGRSSLPSDLCHHFSLGEITAATNNFDSVFIIGVGGFGNVYKGFIDGGTTPVAIKRLNPGSQQGANEFQTEIEMLSQLRHIHLVSLIGYCYEDGEMILVYDYMGHGTLRDHLYKTDNPPLSWNQRLEICIGSARGLQYLHSEAKQTIIHRDVKTTNILLDENWVAKVSDFGLSKIGPTSMSKGHVSTVVKGSFGYVDPEYYRLQQLTDKSDVYSFGVVLCEILCAKPPVNKSGIQKPASLAEHFRLCYRKGMLNEIIDPYLDGKIAPECLKRFAEIAASCLLEHGIDRPPMADVVWGLEFALQLQKSAEEKIEFGEAQTLVDVSDGRATKDHSTASSNDLFSNSSSIVIGSRIGGITTTSSSEEMSLLSINSETMMSGAVFSEMRKSEGR